MLNCSEIGCIVQKYVELFRNMYKIIKKNIFQKYVNTFVPKPPSTVTFVMGVCEKLEIGLIRIIDQWFYLPNI